MGMYSSLEGTNVPSSQNGLPNVSQFGWTSYEMEEYKQLIEYVDEAKRYNNEVKDNIVYVEALRDAIDDIKKHIDETVAGFDVDFSKIEEFKNLIQSWYDQIRDWKDHIEALHTDITAMRDYLDTIRIEILSLRDQVQALKDAASISETNAANSATVSSNKAAESLKSAQDAQKAFQDCYDLYLDLVKGQIYRGTWNPNSGSYPDAKNTNSVWDVVLNPNQEEVVFDNKRWFWGDRLIYVLTDNTFNQIEAGTVVKSVNGKVGAVTLTAIDVNAVPVTGGEMTGTLVHRTTGDIPFQTFFNPTDNSYMQANHKDDYLTWRFGGTDTTKGFRINDYDNERFTFQRNGQLILKGNIPLNSGRAQLFHDGNTSAPGTLFPTRSMREHLGATWIWEKVADGAIYYSTGTDASKDSTISLNAASGHIRGKSLQSTGTVYTNHGSTTVGGAVTGGGSTYFEMAPKLPGDSDHRWRNALRYYEDGWRIGPDYKIYHQGFKPTLSELGAAPSGYGIGEGPRAVNSQDQVSGGLWRDTSISAAGVTIPYDGTPTLAHIAVDIAKGQLMYGIRSGGTTSTPIIWRRAYTENHPPSAAAVGALPSTGSTVSSSYGSNSMFLSGNAPALGFKETDNSNKEYHFIMDGGQFRLNEDSSTGKRVFNWSAVTSGSAYRALSTDGVLHINGTEAAYKGPAGWNIPIACKENAALTSITVPPGSDHHSGIGVNSNGAVYIWNNKASWGYAAVFDGVDCNIRRNLQENGSRVYSPNNKPTPNDVGMHGKSIGTPKELTTEDLDSIQTTGVYAQHANANTSAARHYPENAAGSLIVTGGAGIQQRYHVYNSSRVWTRAKYSTSAWTTWARAYDTINKPSATDVGAVSRDGDTIRAQLTCSASYLNSTNSAHIFHNGSVATGQQLNVRSIRENSGATWIWEKVAGGVLIYSTGTNGGGSTKLSFNINSGTGQAVGGFSTGSDSRFKEDIQYVPTVRESTLYLDKMCSLNAARFKYKGVSTQRFGLIAQDVEKVLPDAVESHFMGADSKSEERLFLDPLAIIAAQNEALKELRALVESLQSRVTVLENA